MTKIVKNHVAASTSKRSTRKRGRPRGSEIRPWIFLRAALVLMLFDEMRDVSLKQSAVIENAIAEFKQMCPDMAMSATLLKGLRHEFQAVDDDTHLIFSRRTSAERDSNLQELRSTLEAFKEDFKPYAERGKTFPDFLWKTDLIGINIRQKFNLRKRKSRGANEMKSSS